MKDFHLRLVTPDRVLMDQRVVSVSLPTAEGEITVLPHHAMLAALLVAGVIKLTTTENKREEIAVSSGFIHITNEGEVMVLADTAERGEELNLPIIEAAQTRAKEVMKQAVQQDDVAFAAAAAGLERELARFKVAHRHHREKGLPLADRGEFPSVESSE